MNGQIAVVIVDYDRLIHLQSHETKCCDVLDPATSILPLSNLRNIWYDGSLVLGSKSEGEVYLDPRLLRETWALLDCLFFIVIFICRSGLGCDNLL